jgi:hypothetical protein
VPDLLPEGIDGPDGFCAEMGLPYFKAWNLASCLARQPDGAVATRRRFRFYPALCSTRPVENRREALSGCSFITIMAIIFSALLKQRSFKVGKITLYRHLSVACSAEAKASL